MKDKRATDKRATRGGYRPDPGPIDAPKTVPSLGTSVAAPKRTPRLPDKRWIGWAVERPGTDLYVQSGGDEATAWRIALGWPSQAEIEDAKANGARAFPVWIAEASG